LWLHSLKVAQLLRSAACLHTNQSRSYLNHLVVWLSGATVALNKTMTHLLPKQTVRNKTGTTEIAQRAFTEYTLKYKNRNTQKKQSEFEMFRPHDRKSRRIGK